MGTRAALIVFAAVVFPLHAMVLEQVKGTAHYLQRMALPPESVFEARVEDVSKADAPAEGIGSLRIENRGNPPIPFDIGVDPKRIDERRRYSVRATITMDRQIRFVTDRAYPVPTQGHGEEVQLLLRAADLPKRAAAGTDASVLAQLPASFTGASRSTSRCTMPKVDC